MTTREGRGYRQYACGYLIGEDQRVVLIRKNRPDWQAGRLNGVGGKVEPGETPVEAMRREFREEAGLDIEAWDHFATIAWSTGETHFFRCFVSAEVLDQVRTMTDEAIEVLGLADAPAAETVPSVAWLLPLALYPTPLSGPVEIREAA